MKKILALIVGIAMMAPSLASASGGSTCAAYNPQLPCNKVSNVTAQKTNATNAASTGTLPFTGVDLVLLVAGGSALLGTGLVVRRLSRESN